MTTYKLSTKRYTAMMFGASWAIGPSVGGFRTIRDARDWAEEFGTTANSCSISTVHGVKVAEHRRDTSGGGTRWFSATP